MSTHVLGTRRGCLGAIIRRDEYQLTQHQKDEIIRLVASGEHPIDAEIANIVGAPTLTVSKYIDNDQELQELRACAQREIGQKIEQAAIDICLNSRVDVARVQMIKEMLPKLKPEVYGEEAAIVNKAKGVRRVMLGAGDLPEVSSPKPPEILKSKSPLE